MTSFSMQDLFFQADKGRACTQLLCRRQFYLSNNRILESIMLWSFKATAGPQFIKINLIFRLRISCAASQVSLF